MVKVVGPCNDMCILMVVQVVFALCVHGSPDELLISGGEGLLDMAANFANTPALRSPMKPEAIHRGVGFGAGTEARGTPQNFSHPYAFVTEEGEESWIANVHIINTALLTEREAHHCLECPCTSEDRIDLDNQTVNGQTFDHSCNGQLIAEGNTRCSLDTYYGGLFCCEDGELCLEAADLPDSEPTTFYLRYTIQYAEVAPDVKPLYLAGCCDATGDLEHVGAVEYNIPKCNKATNPGCMHIVAARQTLGGQSSVFAHNDPGANDREVEIVFAVGHQHRGGMGIHLYDDKTGEMLCESRPVYGTMDGEIGNEKGYIVSMSTCSFDPPLRRRLSDIIRIVSLYNSAEEHTGVMGLFYIALADASSEEAAVVKLPSAQADKLVTPHLSSEDLEEKAGEVSSLASVQELARSSKVDGRLTMPQRDAHIPGLPPLPPPPSPWLSPPALYLLLVSTAGLIAGVVLTLAIVKLNTVQGGFSYHAV